MLVAPRVTYPGVYIQEVPSDVRTIVGVDTATTAFIGRARRGLVNTPVVIHNYGDFERNFGGLWLKSTLGYAVRSFFLNGGAKAVIVRSFRNVTPEVIDAIEKAAAVTTPAPTVADLKAAADAKAATFDNTQEPLKTFLEKFNAAVTAQGATVASVLAATRANTPRTKANLTINAALLAAQNVARAAQQAAALNDATKASVIEAATKAAAVYGTSGALHDAADEILQEVTNAADLAAIKQLKYEDLTAAAGQAHGANATLVLEAVTEGSWSNKLQARIVDVAPVVQTALAAQHPNVADSAWFTLVLYDGETGITEEFANVTLVDSPRKLDKVLVGASQLARMGSPAPTMTPVPHAPPLADELWKDDWATTKVETAGQATDADKLDSNAVRGSYAAKSGIYALEDTNIFNLLCIPPFDGQDVSSMNPVSNDVWVEAAKYCTDQRAMLIVDAPWNSKVEAVTGMPLFAPSANAVLYFPLVTMANPLRDNQLETFAPSGLIAGIIARTDATRGVWKAPAGLDATLNGVAALAVALTDDENGELNPLGVNCLRSRPAVGSVIWGARTLVGDDRLASQWKYLPVRRTALFIEETIYRNIQWAVFEPNDEPLWAQLRLNIGVFMNGLFRQGAFQGQSAKAAYFVKCDSTTTTQADIDKGIVNVVVGFAPLKPAEFVVIYLQQIAGQLAT